MSSQLHTELLAKELVLQKELTETKLGLPHLYGYPWYNWAREFFDSMNRVNLLCAANQISKSSTQIRKAIHWATETSLWPSLWREKPNQFWYMYPSQKQVNVEFETKWKLFLPKGRYKNDPKYGWKEQKDGANITAIHFNSGVHLYFKTYTQDVHSLQTGTVYALFLDEEVPLALYDELIFRISACDGYFHMVFTATIGQDFWRRALEPGPHDKEVLPGAWKKQVSLYDSQRYLDGSLSPWTDEKIAGVIARCKNNNEVLKRVFGKFVMTGGRKYGEFQANRHMKEPHPLPKDWIIYCGVDPGSGGTKGHAAAICYVAVKPNYREGRVFCGWRGDGEVTDNSAIVRKHLDLMHMNKFHCEHKYYDWASKDFFIVASGMGENFLPADKSHAKGEDIINTLFKNDMMYIYEDGELGKLAGELSSLKADENKRHALDNFADAFRYAVTSIPWDFSGLMGKIQADQIEKKPKLSNYQQEVADRRKQMMEDDKKESWPDPLAEMDEWNDIAGTDY